MTIYYKMRQLFFSKMRQKIIKKCGFSFQNATILLRKKEPLQNKIFLLQNATFITNAAFNIKCVDTILKPRTCP